MLLKSVDLADRERGEEERKQGGEEARRRGKKMEAGRDGGRGGGKRGRSLVFGTLSMVLPVYLACLGGSFLLACRRRKEVPT